ncbi:MEMO1 family protein [Ignavibacteriales bacterium]
MAEIRKAAVAGMFYPASPEKLERQLIRLFSEVPEQPVKEEFIPGIVAPHAGYMYSGLTAAYAYKNISDKKNRKVIILSPSHREFFGGISIFDGDAYETPFGRINVEQNIAQKMVATSPRIMRSKAGHRDEHGIEVHLPFLQHLYGNDFEFVPVVMGDQSHANIVELSNALLEVMDDDTLVVASSDLSHFYPKSVAHKLDSVIAERIVEYDPVALENDLEMQLTHACGGGLVVALMKATKRAGVKHSLLLHRSDSGDVSGDNSSVVGYLSASFYN